MLKNLELAMLGVLVSSAALADGREWREHGHHDHGYYSPYPIAPAYAPAPVYYGPPPAVYGYPPVSPGMAGGMAGSALGYGLSGGNPVAAGMGAAAGAMFGNGVVR